MSVKDRMDEIARLEQERDRHIDASNDELKLGGSAEKAKAHATLAVVYQMRIDQCKTDMRVTVRV